MINGYKDQECRQQLETEPLTSGRRPVLSAKQMHSQEIWYSREDRKQEATNHVGILCGKTDSGDWIAVHCSSSKNGVTVGEAMRKLPLYQKAIFLSGYNGGGKDESQL